MGSKGVYLIGQSMIADMFVGFLTETEAVFRIMRFPTIAIAQQWMDEVPPSLVVIVDDQAEFVIGNLQCIPILPAIPLIILNIQDNSLNVVTTTQLKADTFEMMGVVRSLVGEI